MKPLICSVFCLAATLGATFREAGAADTQTVPVRVVTFNVEFLTAPRARTGSIENYRFDWGRRQHLERVAAVIETLAPDVLNLPEVTSKQTVDALIEILHEKGLTDYRGYHVDGNDTFTALDVALITKYEPDTVDGVSIRTIYSEGEDPTWRQAFEFPGRSGGTVRQMTSLSRNSLYFITIAGHKLGFFGLHLKSNPEDAYSNARRTAEAKLVQRVLRSEILSRGYVPIVLGDLNDYDPDVPDRDETRSPVTTVLRDIKDFDPEQSGPELENVAKLIVRQADRYSSHWDWNENGAPDGQDVFTMIDHVLLAKELMPHVTRVFIAHITSLDTSDHYPIVVDLNLPVLAEEHQIAAE